MNTTKNYSILLLFISTLVLSCSNGNSPIKTGADDNPNFIKGAVIIESESFDNVTVTLKRSVINKKGESEDISINETKVDSTGQFDFLDLTDNFYSLFAKDSLSNYSAIFSHISPGYFHKFETSQLDITLGLNSTLIGRVFKNHQADSITISILGTDITASTDSLGQYSLENVPQGLLFLSFTSGSSVGFLPIKTTNISDTLFLKDIFFHEGFKADIFNSYVQEFASQVLYMNLEEYSRHSRPQWYRGKDFSNVDYIGIHKLSKK